MRANGQPGHRGTTAHVQAAYPFVAEGGLGGRGLVLNKPQRWDLATSVAHFEEVIRRRLPDLAQRGAPNAPVLPPSPVRIQTSDGAGFRLVTLPRDAGSTR